MASDEKTEEDLLALDDDTDIIESKHGEVLDSKEEDKLLSRDENESDVEYVPEPEDAQTSTFTNITDKAADIIYASSESLTLISEENKPSSCKGESDQSSNVVASSNEENGNTLPNNDGGDDSDEDIVEIAVVKNISSQQTQNSFETGSSNLQAEKLRRAREEERNRLLQREKVSEFNFRSNRLQQQRKRVRYNTDGRPVIYADDFEFCDCLLPNCPGCHYPCKSCGDCRCGHECRVNRRYVYESIELEGRNITLKTPKPTTKSPP